MRDNSGVNRRDFLKISATAGAGLMICIYLQGCRSSPTTTTEPTKPPTADPEPTNSPEPESTLEPNIYLSIDTNGDVTITAFRSEMGQGIRTAIAMIVGEELDVDWSMVRVKQAPADPAYGDQVTGGSASVSRHYSILRQAGATARQILITAAAQTWGVEENTCITDKGVVVHSSTERRLTFGELVEIAANIPIPGRQDVILKEPQDFQIIGTPRGNFDSRQMVDGSAVYGIDVKLPGMLYATVAQCPVFGGSVASYDASNAERIEGVRHILEISSGIAVVAENTWAALQGKRALEITWDEGEGRDTSSEGILQAFKEQAQSQIGTFDNNILHATYMNPFEAHATMEPMNCTADVRADGCDVWAPTQNPQSAKQRVRNKTKLPDDAVTVHVPLIGGGFGRRLQVDYVDQAVEISQAVGIPVQVIWTREDDIQHDFYHPIGLHIVSTRLDTPRLPSVRSIQLPSSVPTGAWRSVGNFPDAFARESFLDELAFEIGKDPYELRLEILPESHRPALELAAEKAGWGDPLPASWGRGIACYSTFNVTPVAHVAEVSVDADGKVHVHRVVCAVDCGTVINPDNVKAQMEGGIAFGLTAALKAVITVKGGIVEQTNFHDYPLLPMDEMPVVETYIVPSHKPPTGIGEMGVPPITPAVLNAIFNTTGKRIRRIPVNPEDLRKGAV